MFDEMSDGLTTQIQASCCYVILGMHRSGTSSLMGLLQESGVWVGKVFTRNTSNLKGNRENMRIVGLNQAVLTANGGSWDQPPLKVVWPDNLVKRRKAIVEEFAKHKVWGFKDPRTLLTLDGWLESLPKAQPIGTFRHPASVAMSLHKRSKMHIQQGFGLWLAYNEKLVRLYQHWPFPLISFDMPAEQYLEKVEFLVRRQELNMPRDGFKFFENRLRHWQAERQQLALPPQVARMYHYLTEISI